VRLFRSDWDGALDMLEKMDQFNADTPSSLRIDAILLKLRVLHELERTVDVKELLQRARLLNPYAIRIDNFKTGHLLGLVRNSFINHNLLEFEKTSCY
jgi:hypothetical protein